MIGEDHSRVDPVENDLAAWLARVEIEGTEGELPVTSQWKTNASEAARIEPRTGLYRCSFCGNPSAALRKCSSCNQTRQVVDLASR